MGCAHGGGLQQTTIERLQNPGEYGTCVVVRKAPAIAPFNIVTYSRLNRTNEATSPFPQTGKSQLSFFLDAPCFHLTRRTDRSQRTPFNTSELSAEQASRTPAPRCARCRGACGRAKALPFRNGPIDRRPNAVVADGRSSRESASMKFSTLANINDFA